MTLRKLYFIIQPLNFIMIQCGSILLNVEIIENFNMIGDFILLDLSIHKLMAKKLNKEIMLRDDYTTRSSIISEFEIIDIHEIITNCTS